MTCKHEHFSAEVNANRLSSTDGGPVDTYMLDIKVFCAQCDTQFEFLGLEPGLDMQGARVSIDGQEARLAITPPGVKPNPLQRLSFNIGKFDS